MNSTPDITLQINVCAGDLAYADAIVSTLVNTHRADVREVLIVADACRPQSTPILHSPSRFPAAPFNERIAQLRHICAQWLATSLVDRVEWIEPGTPQIRALNQKYLGQPTDWTHDHLGHALTAYFAGWEAPRTRYVLHFDGDILLHQAPGFSWLRAAVAALEASPRALALSPRIAPPMSDTNAAMVDELAPGNGWQPTWPLRSHAHGWSSEWFSTRCHLLDRERLAARLPLVSDRGRAGDARNRRINRLLFPLYDLRPWIADPAAPPKKLSERIASRLARRVIPPFPLPPEVLLHETAIREKLECLYLGDPRVWYLHPDTKPREFVELLPDMIAAVSIGVVPAQQRGFTSIRFSDWRNPAQR